MASPAAEVVDVVGDTLPAAQAFLDRYPETTLFLSSNLTNHGPRLGAALNSGNFRAVREQGNVVAVFCLTRRGNLLAETGARVDLSKIIVEACQRETIRIQGVIGEWNAAQSLEELLKREYGFVESYRSREGLFRLELSEVKELAPRSPCVRLLAPADFDDWEPLNLQFLEEEGIPVQGSPEQRRALFEATASEWHWWGYVADGRLCGTIALNAVHELVGQVGGVFTLPEYRRRGIARAMLNALIGDCHRIHGLTRLVLFTGERNAAAQSLYESAGFERIGEFAMFFASGPGTATHQE